jgi:hypothetical protein
MEKKVSAEKVGQFRFSGTAAHPGVSLRFEALVLQDRLQDISTTGVDSGGREGTAGDSIDGEKQPEIVVLRQKSCAISQLVKNGYSPIKCELEGRIPAAFARVWPALRVASLTMLADLPSAAPRGNPPPRPAVASVRAREATRCRLPRSRIRRGRRRPDLSVGERDAVLLVVQATKQNQFYSP